MIRSAADIAEAHNNGGFHVQPFHKICPSTFSTALAWYDSAMSGLFPRASYYPGDDYKFTLFPESNHLSIWHGGDVSPSQKILRKINLRCSAANLIPSRYILCDYLGFYGGISWESSDPQILNNTVTLPRYTDGKGVRAFLVQLFGSSGGSTYTINYTNTCNEDKTSPIQTANSLGTGGLQNGQTSTRYNPFIDLQAGCSGIKRINSLTVNVLGSGIAVLVLVKPLAEIIYRDASITACSEIDYLIDKSETPIIYDGAKLNFIFSPIGNPTGLIYNGYCEFAWS